MSRLRMGTHALDGRVVGIVTLLLFLSVALVFGASAYTAAMRGDSGLYLTRQMQRVMIGIAVALVAARVPYRRSALLAQWGLWGAIVLLAVVVAVPKFSRGNAGIDRWISILGVTFQPVELAKLMIVLALPGWIDREPMRLQRDRRHLARLLAPVGLVVLLLVAQPNFGSALALVLVTAGIVWVGGVRRRDFFTLVLVGALAAMVALQHHPKLQSRTASWWHLLVTEEPDLGIGYQSYNAMMGLGNGGLWGADVEHRITPYEYVPEQHTDFVFAVAGEKLGLAGTLGILLLFGLLVARAMKVATRSRDGQGYLTAVAIGLMIGVYTLLNLAVVTGLIPVAGLPLPFLSYGGSALVTNMAAVGVLLNIAQSCRRPRRSAQRFVEVRR